MLFGAETEPKSDPNPASVSPKIFETETEKESNVPLVHEDVPELPVIKKKSKETILEELNEISNKPNETEQKTEIVTKNETKLNFNIFGIYFN